MKIVSSFTADSDKLKQWKELHPNLTFSQRIRMMLDADLNGAEPVIKKIEADVNRQKEALKNGELVRTTLKETVKQEKEVKKEAVEKSEEMQNAIRKWHSMQVRANNEESRLLQKQADELKKKICEKFNLTLAELVELSERL